MSALLDILQSQPDPLFGLFDGARDPDVLTLLYSHDATVRSLYDGPSEATLGPKGPYLAELSPGSTLLRAMVRTGWGKAWGLYLTAPASFDDVRRHFRTLLMVRRQKDGSELYFRFYDPRALRVFLPTCSAEQIPLVFGQVSAFLLEAPAGRSLLCFVAAAGQVRVEERSLARSAHA